jgi:hypothetical protein
LRGFEYVASTRVGPRYSGRQLKANASIAASRVVIVGGA